jgi:hypothetical protein
MHWNNGIHWDITFSKAFHDWELEILTSFLDLIYSIKIKGNGEDRMCWMPTRSSMFEVKSFYKMEILQLFRGNVFGGSRTKVVVFSWKAN